MWIGVAWTLEELWEVSYLMWDSRIVERIDTFVGEVTVACSFWGMETSLNGLLLGYMVPVGII